MFTQKLAHTFPLCFHLLVLPESQSDDSARPQNYKDETR